MKIQVTLNQDELERAIIKFVENNVFEDVPMKGTHIIITGENPVAIVSWQYNIESRIETTDRGTNDTQPCAIRVSIQPEKSNENQD